MTSQEKLESIFQTVDALRNDLSRCGMRLEKAADVREIILVENCDFSFKVIYGIKDAKLIEDSHQGDTLAVVERNRRFLIREKIAICNPGQDFYELNEIRRINDNRLTLSKELQKDYPKDSTVVGLKEVKYRFFPEGKVFKRKVNQGHFRTLLEQVNDFYVKIFPETCSVLYRIEIDFREQIRGYIFLNHFIEKDALPPTSNHH